MAQTGGLGEFAERRRLLVASSDELRQRMTEDFVCLRASAVWAERGLALFRTGRRVWPLLAGAAGLLLARKGAGWFSTVRRLRSWWRLGLTMSGLWQSVRAGFAAAQHSRRASLEENE